MLQFATMRGGFVGSVRSRPDPEHGEIINLGVPTLIYPLKFGIVPGQSPQFDCRPQIFLTLLLTMGYHDSR